jgi:hypothetical protein
MKKNNEIKVHTFAVFSRWYNVSCANSTRWLKSLNVWDIVSSLDLRFERIFNEKIKRNSKQKNNIPEKVI